MASRQEEKERRRRERLEAEQASARAASRKRMLQIASAAALALIVIGVIAIVALAGGGGGNDKVDTSSLAKDATAAGCTFKSYPSEVRNHTTGKAKYKTNPPTSGNHNPTPAQDGIYAPGNEPPPESYVHSLEHGRVEYEYKPGTPQAQVAQMQKLALAPINGSAGYHMLMFQNNTKMPSQFALAAWTKLLTCNAMNAKSMNVMRQFRKAYTDKGPEFIP